MAKNLTLGETKGCRSSRIAPSLGNQNVRRSGAQVLECLKVWGSRTLEAPEFEGVWRSVVLEYSKLLGSKVSEDLHCPNVLRPVVLESERF